MLKQPNGHIQFVVFLFYRKHKDHSYICAGTKVLRIIGNYQSSKILFCYTYCFMNPFYHFTAHGIHFSMEHKIEYSISQIKDC